MERGTYAVLGPEVRAVGSINSHESEVSESETEAVFFDCQEIKAIAIKRDLWQRFSNEQEPDVFGFHNLRIAADSGYRDVPKLLYPSQYAYAIIKVAGVLINCYVLFAQNMKVVFAVEDEDSAETEARSKFLVTAWLACKSVHCAEDSTEAEDHLHLLIPLLEIAYMLFNILAVFTCAICSVTSAWCCEASRWSLFCWSNAANLFFEYLQELVSFSALKILYYVTPLVLVTQGYTEVVHAIEGGHGVLDRLQAVSMLVWFVVSRFSMLLFGFDAFLVKFRIVSDYIDVGEMNKRGLVVAILFLFQVLGAVKVTYFVRERLYTLIFGGQDGQVNVDEKQLYKVWEALMVRKIYETFGWFKGTIVMLGFDDYDFQTLVLDDDEEEMRMRDLQKEHSEELEFQVTDRVKLS